ncbi:MAG TPA: glycine cleavage T C-terminal barrel domain-containing protein [Terriglobia bacterium]|nr:glycine cleavage T C-terminal barrel domain-containing protein [Candidatus Acidoferrum sp.]HMD85273.1 glycine cleavage T C-terminal barrel domain-containing protein [Terriglobia bacterium]
MEEQSEELRTALEAMHLANRATLGTWFGCALPDRFGDWRVEYGYLRESVGVVDKNYRAYLSFTGPDRVRYLNAILTNNIKELAENHGTVSLFLNPQGHIQAEIETYALGEELFCVSYAMIRERLIEGLEKYIIMDDVTLSDQTEEYATLAVEGPKAAEVAAELTGVDLGGMAELESREVSVGAVPCRMVRRSPGGVSGAEFLAKRGEMEALWKVVAEAARRHGGGPAGYTALNVVRLEQRIPWFGSDFGEKQIPHEAGLQDSHISYTKGCYTGQEIVERVRSRGQVNRVRVSLQFDAAENVAANTVLMAEGKEVGFLTRTGFSPGMSAWIGMGYVRREKAGVGTKMELAGGTATVI